MVPSWTGGAAVLEVDAAHGPVRVRHAPGTPEAPDEPVTVPKEDDPVSTPAAADITMHHDANNSPEASTRYEEAIGLLDAAERSYTAREVTGADEVERLAGVSGTVMPRFFLGDPAAADYRSQPGVNNGGLRWLRRQIWAHFPMVFVTGARVPGCARRPTRRSSSW